MQEIKDKKSFLKTIALKKIIYPLISVFFALIVILFFFSGVKFIAFNVNRTFAEPTAAEIAGEVSSFDRESYILVAKKLGINLIEEEKLPAEPVRTETEAIATSTAVLSLPAIGKNEIRIAIYNSTATAGLAARLKGDLIAAGFAVAETGTVSPTLNQTIVKIKDTLAGLPAVEDLKTVVSQKYKIAITDVPSVFDIEIIIGKE